MLQTFDNYVDRVKAIIKEQLEMGEAVDQLGPDDDLTATGLNSLSFVKLVVGLEAEFDIEFVDEDLIVENFQTLRTLVEYIQAKREGGTD